MTIVRTRSVNGRVSAWSKDRYRLAQRRSGRLRRGDVDEFVGGAWQITVRAWLSNISGLLALF